MSVNNDPEFAESEFRITIPCNSSKSGFLRNRYKPELLGTIVGKNEFDDIVNKGSHILYSNYSIGIKLQQTHFTTLEKIMFYILTVAGFAFLIISYYLPQNKENIIFLIVWISLILIFVFVIMFIMIHNVFLKSDIPLNINEKIRTELKLLVEKANKESFDSNQAFMILHDNFYLTIELTQNLMQETNKNNGDAIRNGTLPDIVNTDAAMILNGYQDDISDFVEDSKLGVPQLRFKNNVSYKKELSQSKKLSTSENLQSMEEESEI